MQQLRNIRTVCRRTITRSVFKSTLICASFAMPLVSLAQKTTIPIDDCSDCKNLNEVQVFGFSPQRFMSGLKIQQIDSASLSRFQHQTLADFLQYQTPIAFKSYGAGQLTTISFRGTSANHTAVLWNGLNINSPTLGQTDFSTIPLLGFDKMAIQYGSAASCVGSDAVGGSVLLSSTPNLNSKEGINTVVSGQYGSFNNANANLGIRFTKNTDKGFFANKTLFYGNKINNQFPYEARTDRKGREYQVEPSETNQVGLVQDIYFKPKKNPENLFYLNIWLTDNKLTIQPDIIEFREITQTQAYRFLAGSQLKNTSLKVGFIRDILDYGKGVFLDPSHAQTDRYIVRGEHDFYFKQKHELRIGSEIVHYATRVDGYGGNLIHENRGDAYALLRSNISTKLSTSINLRQAFSDRFNVPFTPSFGVDYKLFAKQNTQVTLTGNIAKSYRLPSLNERYWRVLGNPDIKPERGLNKEIGIELRHLINKFYKTTIAINAFHNLIDDWTYWNPAKNYRVENLQQVLSKGLEITSSLKFNDFLAKKTAGVILSYSLTNTSQQKVYDIYAADIIGKQLVYVPRHAASGSAYYGQQRWNASLQAMFNSARYITFDHSGQPFPPHFILNATLNYKLNIFHKSTNLVLQANNLTNTVYPSVKKNAMPGTNFQLSFIFNFNQ